MRSVMPGDRWTWCYVHEVTGELAHAPGSAVKNLKNQTSEKGKTSS
jgi:hypothetical protein